MALARLREPGLEIEPDEGLQLVRCIGPHQINVVREQENGTVVTVTYPVGSDTVLSVDETMHWSLKPLGTQGPFECALIPKTQPERLVYAPKGVLGEAFLLLYTNDIPND